MSNNTDTEACTVLVNQGVLQKALFQVKMIRVKFGLIF